MKIVAKWNWLSYARRITWEFVQIFTSIRTKLFELIEFLYCQLLSNQISISRVLRSNRCFNRSSIYVPVQWISYLYSIDFSYPDVSIFLNSSNVLILILIFDWLTHFLVYAFRRFPARLPNIIINNLIDEF